MEALGRLWAPGCPRAQLQASGSGLCLASGADSLPDEDRDVGMSGSPLSEVRWGEASDHEDEPADRALPEDPETCLQLNMVYQEVVREKLAELRLLLAQNREQQEEILWLLAGSKGPRVKGSRGLPQNVYIGHFMKPYFKDKVTGVGPPANEDAREKATQGIKTFEELLVTKWKSWERALLRKSVVSDRLQRLLQPKLLKLEYLRQKQSQVSGEPERQALEKQAQEAAREIERINQLPEEVLLGNRLDSHDWEKISNVTFEGGRSAEEIRKFWQNSEHPSINKQEWSAEEAERLRAVAAAHGHLEWQKVAEELGTGRSAFQCLQKFQQQSKALKRKEWTAEEDRLLTQLVQEMRVGSHIPYRRIVYYMEGRDSMQLIYRWTKSLDPSLKKGSWAPEEDAKLLQAVAKHREQNWFKIRQEVPGRSDAQCRDRYIRRLHSSLKKGRWNPEEEQQLVQLIGKHGVGRWAKIASELPHRSGSQCLSKWKIMKRQRPQKQQRRRLRRRSVRWSSSSSDSSDSAGSTGGTGSTSGSSSEDSEAEPEEPRGLGRVLPSPQYVVPDMDLWVPARQSTGQPRGGAAGGWMGQLAAGGAQGDSRAAGAHSPVPRGDRHPEAADPQPASSEEALGKGGKQLPNTPLETVLRTHSAAWSSSLKAKLSQSPLPSSAPGPGPGDGVTAPHLRRLWRGTFQNRQRPRRHTLHRRLLRRRLLLAVAPWVDSSTLSCPQAPPAAVPARADRIRARLERVHLPSTPVFALLIQLFQIDTAGCMKVVEERKAQLPVLPQAARRNPAHLAQAPSRAQDTPGRVFPNPPPPQAARDAGHRGSARLPAPQAPSSRTPPQCGPRPKPKTVSELLREKHLREARARKAAMALAPRLLVSPVVLPPPLPPASLHAPALGPGVSASASAGAAAPCQEARTAHERSPALQGLPLALAVSGASGDSPALGPSQVPAQQQLSGAGQREAPAVAPRQGLPEAPFISLVPSPALQPVQPLGLTPALGTHTSGPQVAPSVPLPLTWVLTAQGLLPVQLPPLANLPMPAGTPQGLPPPPTTKDTETDPSAPPTPPLSRSPAAGETPVPRASPQPSQLPTPDDTGPRSDPAGTTGPGGQLGLEKLPPPWPGSEKGALDLSLLSWENEAATQAWLKGRQGVSVRPLQCSLPYQPPTLCSLRVLARLLLHKTALEHKAASLAAGGTAEGPAEPRPGSLQASLQLVGRRLQDNPAYLLLKTRFLAAFTLPAFLATLPPPGVPTTLSAATRGPSESEDEDLDLGELRFLYRHRRSGEESSGPGAPAATSLVQGSAPGSAPDGQDVLRTRHSWHPRKPR
ncbi:snRNA-activating protein complex subunit 4 isoform X2 [Lepus europaeus]|uniref:snRNA-activating protein complex subunit 4 isoform X2 n=1 Tax=Lepus europaeus TaxID=9983 RepID=UPI002B464D0D|nr:snRNA-activating protein complex subunit 4 isoform X2 [Lepus europaeus]